jgi:aminoglycoside 3-N-acetyltransferase
MNSSPILVHTDIARLDRKIFRNLESVSEITNSAINYLSEIAKSREIWLPAFNYSFAESRIFDVLNDVSDVGIINETLRTYENFKRSEIPIFSLIRNQSEPLQIGLNNTVTKPFGSNGEFAEIFNLKGDIIFFGAHFHSLTYLHRVEEEAGIKYRYLKHFLGEVQIGDIRKKVDLAFLVRPKGLNLQYDWEKMYLEISRAKLISALGHNVFSINVSELHDFLLQRILVDELWMLTPDSMQSVEEMRKTLGRNYEIGDFE